MARRHDRWLHVPPGEVGEPREGQDGLETEWGGLVTDEEYTAR